MIVFWRTLQRRGVYGEDLDYPPMEPTCFSPTSRGRPPHWDMEPPPPYEVAIKTTRSSTHLRRCYSDTQLFTEPLFGRSREISFEVWHLSHVHLLRPELRTWIATLKYSQTSVDEGSKQALTIHSSSSQGDVLCLLRWLSPWPCVYSLIQTEM